MRARRLLVMAAIATTAFVSTGATASAGLLGCSTPDTDRPFLPWLDVFSYYLAPSGTFEGGASGWSLSGGTAVAQANEPFYVAGSGSRALRLPSGGSATSPTVCVGLASPVIRFFSTGDPGSRVKVEVLYRGFLGRQTALELLLTPSGGAWAPSLPIPVLANITGLLALNGLTTNVQFRFTSRNGVSLIDDFYVDPFRVGD